MKKKNNLKNFLLIAILMQIIIISLTIVSAVCCEKVKNDGFCIDTTANNCDISNDYQVHPSLPCKNTEFCRAGYCYDSDGTCLPGSLKSSCEALEKDWSKTDLNGNCEYGCCWMGTNTQYTYQSDCIRRAKELGVSFIFDDTPQGECHFYTQSGGACMFSNGKCVFTTDEECLKNGGGVEFKEGLLCTYPSLNTGYTKLHHIGCDPTGIRPEIFWFDSDGNRENIYEGNSPSAKDHSWNGGKVLKKESVCGFNSQNGNADSTTCGNCKEGISECSTTGPSEPHVGAGNYICESMDCEDSYFKLKYGRNPRNGEEWCVYDAYVGDGKDVVGSKYWKRSCNNGEITYEACGGDYREKICAEKVVDGTSMAQCRFNLGGLCFGVESKEECLFNYDCKWQVVDVDTYFSFSTCVPKYPKGFNFESSNPDENGKNVCSLATLTCVIYSDWWWVEINSDCNTKEFVEKMNDFCISLGDCGSYINYIGNGTENYAVTGSDVGMAVKWTDYLGYLTKKNSDSNTPWWASISENPGVWGGIIKLLGPIVTKESLMKIPWIVDYEIRGIKKIKKEVTFTCLPWQPPVGGDYCDLCNKDPLKPCSEYRCKSLGTACAIMEGVYEKENPQCYNKYSGERNPPVITFNKIQSGYKFTGNNDVVKITTSGGSCVYNFSVINFFSIKTDEAAECRWSLTSTTFEKMNGYFEEENQFAITHNYNTTIGINIHDNDGLFQIYIKCMDRLGNIKSNDFVMSFCLSSAQDIKAPEILRTEPIDGSRLKKDVTNSSLTIYLNEPSECKYDLLQNVPYENMGNNMSCNNEIEAQRFFCGALLTNLISPVNKIYIKCNDSVGNFMTDDYPYTLFATEENLVINVDSPQNGMIREEPVSEENPLYIKATTEGGADDGNANCKWKYMTITGFPMRADFSKTGGRTHEDNTITILENGTYELEITCKDSAGNNAIAKIQFSLEIDDKAPKIIGNRTEGNNLILTSDEKAKCYYRTDETQDCAFDLVEGNGTHYMNLLDGFYFDHTIIDFSEREKYYIMCEDDHGNAGCSRVIGATKFNDYTAPVVVRIYYKDNKLIVKTDEDARCYYTSNDCSYKTETGVSMDSGYLKHHEAVWTDLIYYRIRCIDAWNNEGCVIEAKASNIK